MSHDEIQKPEDITIPANSLWAKMPMVGGALAVVGLGATLATSFGEHGARSMFSYLFAYAAVLAIALGGLGWLLIDHTVRSSWAGVLRRINETTAATLPLFALLWIPIGTVGFHALYPWTHETDEILERKRWFLTPGFFWGRAVAYLLIWAVLSYVLYQASLKQDGLSNNAAERDRLTRRIWKVSAGGIVLYGLSQSFAAIDWLMSLQPHWYSTIFGVYFFAASILGFFAFLALATMALQRAGVLKTAINFEHLHDVGKLIFGYTIFWAYIAFSQFILIWYANIPEETVFYMVRMEGGWSWISYALPVAHFFVPFFFLLSRHIKRSRAALAAGAVWTLIMHCVDFYWLVLPNFGTHGAERAPAQLALTWTDAAALIGMAGAFLAVFSYLLRRNKALAVNDPRLLESLAHENY